jgi:hypothetical protein
VVHGAGAEFERLGREGLVMSEMKLCTGCRWFRFYGRGCRHEKALLAVDPVDGEKSWCSASHMRMASPIATCGPEAKLWEPSPLPLGALVEYSEPRRWWQFWRPQIRRWRCDGGCGGKCPQCNGGPE